MKFFTTVALTATLFTACDPAEEPADAPAEEPTPVRPTVPAPAAPDVPHHPDPQVEIHSLLGEWEACDGRVVSFTQQGDRYVGHYLELGDLERYGFSVKDEGYRYTRDPETGVYKGEVHWRFTDGRHEWREAEATVTGNRYTDNSSDPCSSTMTRRD